MMARRVCGVTRVRCSRGSSEPIGELVRPIDVEEEHDDAPTLPDWAEDYFADQRRYWTALRDGGVIDLADTARLIRRQVDGQAGDNLPASGSRECAPDSNSEEQG